MNARIKAMAKLREGRGSGSRPTDVGPRPLPALPAPPVLEPSIEEEERPLVRRKRKVAPSSSPPPAKRPMTSAKGKEVDVEGMRRPARASRPDRDISLDVPNFPDPRLPNVPNSHSVFEDLSTGGAWRAFQGLIFDWDQAMLEEQPISKAADTFSYHLAALANIGFSMGRKAHLQSQSLRRLEVEKSKLEKQVEAASPEKIEELETQLATERSKNSELEKRAREVEEENKRLDSELLSAVGKVSELQQRVENFDAEKLEVLKAGEVQGRKLEEAEKEEEFRSRVAGLRLQAVRDFMYSPVFEVANMTLGSNDLFMGWKRAIGQIKALGANFDESQLDLTLDDNLQVIEDDEEEPNLDVQGHEFEPVMSDVDALMKRFEQKQAAAEARRRTKGSSSREPPSSPHGDMEMIEALQPDPVSVEEEIGEDPGGR